MGRFGFEAKRGHRLVSALDDLKLLGGCNYARGMTTTIKIKMCKLLLRAYT